MTRKTKYKPLPGFLVLEPLEELTHGNIALPDKMSAKESAGIVLAVGEPFMYYEGNNAIEVSSPVKKGDKVVYKNAVGQRFVDYETGKWVIMLKFHEDPVYNDLMSLIED